MCTLVCLTLVVLLACGVSCKRISVYLEIRVYNTSLLRPKNNFDMMHFLSWNTKFLKKLLSFSCIAQWMVQIVKLFFHFSSFRIIFVFVKQNLDYSQGHQLRLYFIQGRLCLCWHFCFISPFHDGGCSNTNLKNTSFTIWKTLTLFYQRQKNLKPNVLEYFCLWDFYWVPFGPSSLSKGEPLSHN